jgi:hypothetical protein
MRSYCRQTRCRNRLRSCCSVVLRLSHVSHALGSTARWRTQDYQRVGSQRERRIPAHSERVWRVGVLWSALGWRRRLWRRGSERRVAEGVVPSTGSHDYCRQESDGASIVIILYSHREQSEDACQLGPRQTQQVRVADGWLHKREHRRKDPSQRRAEATAVRK